MLTTSKILLARIAAAVFLMSVAAGPQVWAHDNPSGPNGGIMVDAKSHHVEMTAKNKELTFYLMDDAHRPVSSKGASGRIVVLQGSKQASVALEPREPNTMTAVLDAPLAPGARVVFDVKVADGKSIVARFVKK